MCAYGFGEKIRADLGVQDMILLGNSRHHMVALEGEGLPVAGERRIDPAT